MITDNGGFPESFRSTDRRYALGGRYAFDPLNGESPYRDNTCTATHQNRWSAASGVAAPERFPARLASHRPTSRLQTLSVWLPEEATDADLERAIESARTTVPPDVRITGQRYRRGRVKRPFA
ncbi:MAG TPA: hypothetical protein VFP81_07135 [Propionibacteriaceae bacterium]|nr:hypothetical protein [Propionibacteriaceae bacterium]